jgi:hypothetical protein
MVIGTWLKFRDTLSYGTRFMTTEFTDFGHSGFPELKACVPVAGGINMRGIRSELSSDYFF